MNKLTEQRLAEIHERLVATTPQEWRHNGMSYVWLRERPGYEDVVICDAHPPSHAAFHAKEHKANAEFIAHIHQDLPLLLDALAERDGILHDMQQDQDVYHWGIAVGFARALELLRQYRGEAIREHESHKDMHSEKFHSTLGHIQASHELIDRLLAIANLKSGESPTLLPPDDARAEVLRLRKALRKIANPTRANVAHLCEIASEALGEEVS